MTIERFAKVNDSKFLSISGGLDTFEIENMSGETKEHYFSIRFFDESGSDVIPTAGVVEFSASQFRASHYEDIHHGRFNAADVDNKLRLHPNVLGPVRAVKITLDGVVGAVEAMIKVTSY